MQYINPVGIDNYKLQQLKVAVAKTQALFSQPTNTSLRGHPSKFVFRITVEDGFSFYA